MKAIPRFGRHAFSLLLLFILLPSILPAQDARFRVRHLSTRDGLSQNDVRCIMQDRYGFLWFGTRNGLDKYDGYRFRTYSYDPFDTTSLSDYAVSAIAEDSAGYIWAGTSFGGLNRLDRRTGRSVRFRHDPQDPQSLYSDNIAALLTDRDGSVWIGSSGGLNRYDVRRGRMERHAVGNGHGVPWKSISSLHLDRRHRLWIAATQSYLDTSKRLSFYRVELYRYDRESKTSASYAITSTAIMPMLIIGERPDGRLDLAPTRPSRETRIALHRFDPATGLTEPLRARPEHQSGMSVVPLIAYSRDDYWYGVWSGRDGIHVYEAAQPIHLGPLASDAAAFDSLRTPDERASYRPSFFGQPHTAFRDRSESIWFAMADGATRVSRIGSGFTTWRHQASDPASLSARGIRSVEVDAEGMLWVGTDFGLNRYDRATGGWRHYIAQTPGSSSLPNSTINVLFTDDDGRLLLGTSVGLARYDRNADRFDDPYPALRDPHGSPPSVWSVLRDRRKRLWIGTGGQGLALLDSTGRLLHRFHGDSAQSRGLLKGGVWSLLEEREGTIWIGTNDGLCRWMEESQSFRCYEPEPGNHRSLGGRRIWALHEDREGNVWASSFGGGLSRYDPATDDFTTITTRDGLIDNGVFGLLEDDAGVFWISSTKGLIRWNRRANTFRLYDEGDGLQANEFAYKAFFKADDGTLYFGGVDGLSAFKPSDLRDNPHPPPVHITGFHLFDSLAAPELFDGDTVRLDHTQNFFAFEFAALDYINPGKNRYAYKLEGVDRDWIETDSEHRRASYTDLKPGRYRFRVRGSNNDGVWNEEGTSITVIIAPPWYQTWWFRIAATLFLIGAVVGSVRLRIRSIHRNESEKRQAAVRATLTSQEAERERIARDLHDGIGQTLAAASINLARHHEMLKRENRSPDLDTPLERSMQILDRASREVRAISHGLGTSTLRELGLAAAIGELLEHLESEGTTRFEFATYGLEERLPEPIETGLFRVAQELIANVLRHAGAEEATVQILKENREVRLTVEDNGAGFDLDAPRAGMGLGNITARVAAMGGRVHYDSMPGHGTSVTVVVGAAGVRDRGSGVGEGR